MAVLWMALGKKDLQDISSSKEIKFLRFLIVFLKSIARSWIARTKSFPLDLLTFIHTWTGFLSPMTNRNSQILLSIRELHHLLPEIVDMVQPDSKKRPPSGTF